jgi:predicted DNA-binding transcriptional regulator AlpA
MQPSYKNPTGGDQLCADKLIDLKTLAEHLGIAERSIWRGVSRGEIPKPVKLGKSSRWFTSEIIEFQERLKASRN